MTKQTDKTYVLEDQIGFILRQVGQRHSNIFASNMIEGLTPTQFSVIVKLMESGPCSQNHLGRETAMDVATIKGVVGRLEKRGLVEIVPDLNDKRRLLIVLKKTALTKRAITQGHIVTAETLEPLNKTEQKTLLKLLKRLK